MQKEKGTGCASPLRCAIRSGVYLNDLIAAASSSFTSNTV